MKKILITFLVLVLAVIIGGVTYIFTFDLNSYKAQIEKAISEKTGIPVSIKGQMQFSKSLNPTLVIQDMEIKNPAGFPDTPFMTVKKTELSFDLVAFFKNIINVQNVELSDVTMQLQVNRKGQKNWIDLLQSKNVAEDKKVSKPALSKAAALSPVAQMQIDLISLKSRVVLSLISSISLNIFYPFF